MKRIILMAIVAVAVLVGASANAAVYYFTPPQPDLQDLDHNNYKSWGIEWTLPGNEVITGATLTITNIWDWTVESDNLYIHLLDSPLLGMRTWRDGELGGDNFANAGPLLINWTDPVGGQPRGFDLVIEFDAVALANLNDFVGGGDTRFGFGFDPDCHYYNDGVRLQITTETLPTPEPATMALFGLGMAGLGLIRRKKD